MAVKRTLAVSLGWPVDMGPDFDDYRGAKCEIWDEMTIPVEFIVINPQNIDTGPCEVQGVRPT